MNPPEPKYKIWQKVYYISDQLVGWFQIKGIFYSVREKVYKYTNEEHLSSFGWFTEDRLFETTEELFKMLEEQIKHLK